MKSPSTPALDLAAFDAALGAVTASGWGPSPQFDRPGLDAGLPAPLGQPMPEPVREAAQTWLQETREPQAHGGELKRVEYKEPAIDDSERSEVPTKALLDVGILSDLVSGVRTPHQAAADAGVTQEQLHSALAVTLSQVDPREIAKAMGVQVAATQLKAGAVWNAILADLLNDIQTGRAKADVKLELLKVLKGVARLEPREDKGVGAGGGFSLNINISAGDTVKPVVIDAN